MGHITLSLLVLLAGLYGCQASEWCGSDLGFCTNDCCGYGNSRYCCYSGNSGTDYSNTYTSVTTTISTGIIVAIVISVIIFIAIIVGIIICCVCCCKAATSTSGTVYRAPPPQHVTMVTGTHNAGYAQPPSGYPAQNNAYPMTTPTTGYGGPQAPPQYAAPPMTSADPPPKY